MPAKYPCLSLDVSTSCWAGGCRSTEWVGGWGSKRGGEDVALPSTPSSAPLHWDPEGRGPLRHRGFYMAVPNPPGGDAHPPLPVSAHLPSRWLAGSPCFAQAICPELSGSPSLVLSLSPFCPILSCSLSCLCLSLLLSRAVCLCAPFSSYTVALLQPQPPLWRAPDTGRSKRKPRPSRHVPGAWDAPGDKAPSSLGPPRAASWLQWAALGAVRTSGSPTRARARAQGPPLCGAPRAPFIMRRL